jgi:predicted permease
LTQLFSIFLNILLPVFALVVTGYVAGPRLQLDARTLTKFAYYVLVPSFIFNVFKDAVIPAGLAVRMALFMTLATLGVVVIAFVVARLMGRTGQMVAAYVLVGAFGNVGNFGLPIIQFKLGDEALVAASVFFLVGSTAGFIIGVMAATWHQGSGLNAVWAAFKTPGIIAVFPAFAVNFLDLPVPLFVDRAVGLLAGALIPTMLVTLGIQLSGMGKLRVGRDEIVGGTLRLVAGPALAFSLAPFFGLTGIERGAGILQMSMPVAVLASLIALEHNLMPDFVTRTVLFSTVASSVTLTVVLALI